jgi:hypothetical protein
VNGDGARRAPGGSHYATGRLLRIRARLGGVRLGCLLAMAVVAAAIYYGTQAGQMYLRFYRFQDAFKQEVKFAGHHTDNEIKGNLRALADSLGLPPDAQAIFIKRKPDHILLWNEYYYHLELPFYARDFYFNPHAEGDL